MVNETTSELQLFAVLKLARCRMNVMAVLMVCCLCIVAWGQGHYIKLLGAAWLHGSQYSQVRRWGKQAATVVFGTV